MKRMIRLLALILAAVAVLTACGSEKAPAATEDTAFEPILDTEKKVELNAAVYFGNFEAFDRVINDFNEYYPNVYITYDQISNDKADAAMYNNQNLDIIMTFKDRGYPAENFVDLSAAGVDFSDVADGMLSSNTVDGKVFAMPMGLMLKGMAVNKTLLEKEGLTVPQTWQEFTDVFEALKQKGYTPIQGPDSAIPNLCCNMCMAMLNDDPALLEAVLDGDTEAASALKTVFERLEELYDKGYISHEVNAEYPDNNYDGAILKFFEGDVPFWACDTEKFSGMKKRESKSEAFSANPFDYEFTFAPMGDNGVYAYLEPWYGFSVNKNSMNVDYAVEFLRFMAREDELNALASIKGIPSIAKNAPDGRYSNLRSIEKVERYIVSDGTVKGYINILFMENTAKFTGGELADADAALGEFVSKCAEKIGKS